MNAIVTSPCWHWQLLGHLQNLNHSDSVFSYQPPTTDMQPACASATAREPCFAFMYSPRTELFEKAKKLCTHNSI